MKHTVMALAILFMLVSSCKEKSKTITIKDDNGNTTATVDLSKVESQYAGMQKEMEKLKDMTPLTKEQMKDLLPEELLGMERTGYSINTGGFGTAMARATYKGEGDKKFDITLFDCGGTAGYGLYMAQYYNFVDMEEDNENSHTETIKFGDGKAIVKQQKKRDACTMTYTAAERLMVSIDGKNAGFEGVKALAENLKLNIPK